MLLVLASKSPRRAEILRQAGLEFTVMVPDVDEAILPGEVPDLHVKRLALDKAVAVLSLIPDPDALILAADTVVVLDGTVLGKPRDENDATRMLKSLSGRSHKVVTGYCVLFGNGALVAHDTETTAVTFRPISDTEMRDDIISGEPMDKAGAYALQGRASRYVMHIEGLMSNVIGLPLEVILPVIDPTS